MKLETALAPGVALVDVSNEMPREVNPRTPGDKPLHKRRALHRIERIYCHHSGSEGAPGLQGAKNSARYVVQKRGFHCAAYHYWIPADPLYWVEIGLALCAEPPAPIAMLRLNADSERTWHTGRHANTHGISVCLQGNLNKRDMTPFQKECMEALLPWLARRHFPETWEGPVTYQLPKDWLSWHSDSGQYGGKPKAACPGSYCEAWLRDYLA